MSERRRILASIQERNGYVVVSVYEQLGDQLARIASSVCEAGGAQLAGLLPRGGTPGSEDTGRR
jgi:hypothetical protein